MSCVLVCPTVIALLALVVWVVGVASDLYPSIPAMSLGIRCPFTKAPERSLGVSLGVSFYQVMLQPPVQVSKRGQVEDGTSNRAYIWWRRAGGGRCKLIFPLIGGSFGWVSKYRMLAAESGPNSLIFGIVMSNCALISPGVSLPFVTGMRFALNKGACTVNI